MAKAPEGISSRDGFEPRDFDLAEIRRNRKGLQAYRDIWSSIRMEKATSSGTVPIVACAAILFFFIKPSVSSGLAALGIALGGTIALILAVWAVDRLLFRAEVQPISPTVFEIDQPDDGVANRQYAVFDANFHSAVSASLSRDQPPYFPTLRPRTQGDFAYYLWIQDALRGAGHAPDFPTTYTLKPIWPGHGRIILRDPHPGRVGFGRNWDDLYTASGVKRGNE